VQLTKFTHSCVRLDDGDRALVIDPGGFSEVEEALDGADALLVTHEHADHIDVDRVRAVLRVDPRLRVWAPDAVARSLAEFGEQVLSVRAGDTFDAAGFEVRAFGGQHAVIHPTIPVVANLGYLIAGVYHPGDALIVPPAEVTTLLVPIHAPWSKVSEVIDFVVAARARTVHPVHDALLNPAGLGIVEGHVARIGALFGSEYVRLESHRSVDVT
jgi:L-ascorbate metabolism protein UlaG (beta-lactamase superfamily)